MIFHFGTGGDTNAAKKELYEAMQYSGLVTEDMTFEEMCEVLAEVYPEIYKLYMSSANEGDFALIDTGYSPTFTKGSELYISDKRSNDGGFHTVRAKSKTFTITGYEKMYFTHVSTITYNDSVTNVYVEIYSAKTNEIMTSKTLIESGTSANGTVIIDTSELSGDCYVIIKLGVNSSKTVTTKISNMYLE